MNKKTSTTLKLGVFMTIGFLLFITALYYISTKQQFFNRTFHISGVFRDVSGLQAGNNVRFSGITVGIIESIAIETDSTVRVGMRIEENVKRFIKKDAEATIGSDGLMGNKILIITPGTSNQPEIDNNDMIRTTQPLNMDQALITLKTTGDHVAQITGDLADIVHTIREGKGTIGQLFMDSTYLKQTRENLTRITDDFAVISGTLRSGKGGLGKIIMDSTYLKIPIENAIRMTTDLSEIVGAVHAGHGVMGRLLMDSVSAFTLDTMLVNLKESSVQLNRVSEKAKRSFLLWGF